METVASVAGRGNQLTGATCMFWLPRPAVDRSRAERSGVLWSGVVEASAADWR